MIKGSEGGGGKGMRMFHQADLFKNAGEIPGKCLSERSQICSDSLL